MAFVEAGPRAGPCGRLPSTGLRHQQPVQPSRLSPVIAVRIRLCVSSVTGTKGKRRLFSQRPSRLAAYLTGAGLVSRNSALLRGCNWSRSRNTVDRSPIRHASCKAAQWAGATLAVTEIHPTPPWARNATTVVSSPESWQKSGPTSNRVSSGLAKLAVASFTPTMLGNLASRAKVETDRSTTLRPGIL